MPTDRSYLAANRQSRERLRALVARLGDADLERPLAHGWTVAETLVHLAFWDLRAVVLVDRWEREGAAPSPMDIEVTNEAVRALARAIAPRAATRLAVEAAEAADRRIETLPDHLADAVARVGTPFNLARQAHRDEHVGEIERALR